MLTKSVIAIAALSRRRWVIAVIAFGSTSLLLLGTGSGQDIQPPAAAPSSNGGVVQQAEPVQGISEEAPTVRLVEPAQSRNATQSPKVKPDVQRGVAPKGDQPPTDSPPVVGDPQPPIRIDPGEATDPQSPRVNEPPVQTEPVEPPPLNVDPNADIEDLVPPTPLPPTPPPIPTQSGRQVGLGASRSGFSAAPTMIGDLFGGTFSSFGGFQTVNFSQYAAADVVSVTPPGDANGLLAFEFGADLVPNDVFTTGVGVSNSGDGFADTFAIAEPIPPSDALTSPGPGFVFDGGTAVFTNAASGTDPVNGAYTDGSIFLINYSYTAALLNGSGGGRPLPGPGVAARRVKLAENFSPEVRDRCFFTFNFFNDAFGGLGDISRYTLGFERQLVDQLISFEARLLTAGTYASTQNLDRNESRDFELGNAALITKVVLLRTDRFLWSGGLGVTLPTADDTRVFQGGQELLRVENETVHLLPFSAVLMQLSRDTSMQAYLQLDTAVNGDPVYGDLTGNSLPRLGVFNDSTLMNIDVAMSHVMFRNANPSPLQQIIANAELHYTGTLQPSDFVSNGQLTYTNLKRNFNVVNATAGMHFVLHNDVVVTPAMSVPISDGLDEQFDYEAVVQVNWLR
ncbi:MAG: hypothetical protein AAGG48_15360 [Planctomycetota bacterium]